MSLHLAASLPQPKYGSPYTGFVVAQVLGGATGSITFDVYSGVGGPPSGSPTANQTLPRLRGWASDAFVWANGTKSARGEISVRGYAEAGAPAPAFNAAFGTLPVTSSAVVFQSIPLDLSLADGIGFGAALLAAQSLGASILETLGLQDMTSTVYPVSLAEALGLADSAALSMLTRFSEGLRFGDAAAPSLVYSLRETLGLIDGSGAMLDALVALGEQMTFGDVVRVAYRVLMAETIAIAGNPTAWRQLVLEIADALSLAASARSTWDANVALASALAFGDSPVNVVQGALAETVTLGDTQKATLTAMLKLLDTLRLQDTLPAPSLTLTALVDESLALGADLTLQQELNALIADGVQFLAQITLDDGVYLAWVMNAESHAFTSYSNYPFNSFAVIGGKTYGAKADGIYLLEGDDDAGAAIDAIVRGGLTNFGSSKFKRMPSMYLGYTTDGRMLMKVTVMDDDGVREEHWYGLEDRPAGVLREGRVKLGRGLKSTYWGFELANVDGADFALDSISWYPVVLDRRL